ncbi:MAG: hypothetical protein KBA06_04655, partial [Saprospiraceae bacterium]|nr:hypothetical protein [Saprospiraceae bacterium]
MKNILLLLCFFVFNHTGFSQDFEKQMSTVNEKLTSLKKSEDSLNKVIENIKFQKIQYDLQQVGLPSNDFITHNAM